MTTISDVARKAGVSIATVSRALRNETSVSKVTRSRVRTAAEELRYRPNLNASILAGSPIRTVGVVVPSIDNPFFFDIYTAVSRAVEAHGYSVVLKTTENRQEQLLKEIRHMAGMVAGLVVAGGSTSRAVVDEIETNGLPTVCFGGDGMKAGFHVGYARGIEKLVGYLWDLGHRRLGIMEYSISLSCADPRILALRRILARTPELECRTVVFPDTLEGGRFACRALLSGAAKPTALICIHDVMAVGALREAREQGYSVPRDISVAGLDNIALAGFCAPSLTTVHVARDRVATALCGLLFGEPAPSEADSGIAPQDGELIVRESTAVPASELRSRRTPDRSTELWSGRGSSRSRAGAG